MYQDPTVEPVTLGPAEVGVWLDGTYGWHNNYRVVDRAVECGARLTEEEFGILAQFREVGFDASYGIVDAAMDLSVAATEFLDGLCREGYGFVWDAGELSLVEICDHDNCEPGACVQ